MCATVGIIPVVCLQCLMRARREQARLCMMYKVVHGLVDIPWLLLEICNPSSLTVIRLNFHLFHAQLSHGMLYPQ